MKHIKENNSVYDPKTGSTWFYVPLSSDGPFGRCVLQVDHDGYPTYVHERDEPQRSTVLEVLSMLDPELPTEPGTIIFDVTLKRDTGPNKWAVLGENRKWYLSTGLVCLPDAIKCWGY